MTTGLERHPDRMPWKFLLPIFQNSNRQQVICSAQILQQAGFEIVAARPGEEFVSPDFTPE
jgi:hypothetical protein